MTNTEDELMGLRQFRDALKPDGGATIHRNGKDVTAHELEILNVEIRHLEVILKRHQK